MKLAEIYSKLIDRIINPAVVAQDQNGSTIQVEIEEYVFTDEIINSLYKVLVAIKERNIDKTGIWINGYYGSGKSHFLKYLHYCINVDTREKAFGRFIQAVKDRDAMLHLDSRITMNNDEIASLKRWYDKAEIEDVLFNAQDVSKANRDNTTFTHIFFNMFNECRGYNAYNIPLALLLEKYLDKNNSFDLFKQKLEEEEGFIWDTDAADVVSNELDTVLSVAKKCVPSLDIDALKATLLHPESYHIDTRKFSNEVKSYISTKGEDYRFLFLVDEVSQFINANKDVLLDLQTVIERLSPDCNKQVWIACTAQQTIESVTYESGIFTTDEAYGKIMGRFETRASLESTDPAYITQKRILEKNSTAEAALKVIYRDNQDAILNQFIMGHELYKGFRTEEDFQLSYPFIPYQFKLIAKVFDAFQQLEYVLAEVKDNERSVLKITHETAKLAKDLDLGTFISFDAFFNQMFWQNLIHRGTKAISPALELGFVKVDLFAQRVVKLLFMISNLLDTDKANFGSTLDNLTLLMMTKLDENKLQLRNQIEDVLKKLIENNIVREESKNYYFYNEDEVELSKLIANTQPGSDFIAETFKGILFPWLKVDNKIRFAGNDFKIAASIDGKNYLGTNSDVNVSFTIFDDTETTQKSLSNPSHTLIFCLNEWFMEDKELRINFQWFCKVEKYIKNNQEYATEARKKSIDNFKSRNAEIKLTLGMPLTQEDLKLRANRAIAPNEYSELNPMTDAESMINDHITRQGNELLLSDLLDKYKAAPYGWKDVSIIYIVTELCKRKLRDLTYKNQPRYSITNFVNKALVASEYKNLGITSAQEISQDIINKAIQAWLIIFNEHISPNGDGNSLFDTLNNGLIKHFEDWKILKNDYEKYLFAKHFNQLTDLLTEWISIREPKRLFEILDKDASETALLIDKCRNLKDFTIHSLKDYSDIRRFCELNEENFQHLDEVETVKVDRLKTFFLSDYPVDDFHLCKKTYKELKEALTKSIKDIKAETHTCYNAIFDELDALAIENAVANNVYANREQSLTLITNLQSITMLRLELSRADSFFSDERGKILLDANRQQQEKSQIEQNKKDYPTNKEKPVPIVTEPPASYNLPKANKILTSELEVDEYLAIIRKQMMALIHGNKNILVK
ncbi:MAG: BREX system P-loop protein BrxC [Bacteroidetes bacterium]|nr:BREX system P-loop protein BrxC [Bacteroidota bacterium]